MILNEEVKAVIEGSAFISLVTVGADGSPHPIIVGKGAVSGDTVTFGVYKMEQTRANLANNPKMWAVAATKDGGPKGYRLSGTATVIDKQVIFKPTSVEALI